MAKKKAVESFTEADIIFDHELKKYRLLRLDPNSMNVVILSLDDGEERTLPFAHLPKSVKKQIRPL